MTKATGMTVSRLHRALGKLIDGGAGRCLVFVSKTTFTDNREPDGVTILPVCGVRIQTVPQADDDGGVKINRDGTESLRKTAVVFGSNDHGDRDTSFMHTLASALADGSPDAPTVVIGKKALEAIEKDAAAYRAIGASE